MTTETTTPQTPGGGRTFYMTTRRDGCDFLTGRINYAEALKTGEIVRHPTSTVIDLSKPETFLSVSSDMNALFETYDPRRFFQVEVIGEAVRVSAYTPPWFAVLAFKVVAELHPRRKSSIFQTHDWGRTFYKTVKLDGCDFRTGKFNYAKAFATGKIIRHPTSTAIDVRRHDTCFSVSTSIDNSFGTFGKRGIRLFRVEAIGEAVQDPFSTFGQPNFLVLALKVKAELEARPGRERRELIPEPRGFLANLALFGNEEVYALANAYRMLGRPLAPKLAPEVPKGVRKWHCYFYREKVAREIYRASDSYAWPPDGDAKDATTAAQMVVTALLYLDLLSLEKISDLVAPWCVALGDGYINWRGNVATRNRQKAR